MRPIFTCLLLLIGTSGVLAQNKLPFTYSASLNPSVSLPINISSSKDPVPGKPDQTYSEYADSVRSFETYKLSLGATVWANYVINRKWSVQAGVGYSETGFTRQQRNITFNATLMPGIGSGRLQELSNSQKSIDYTYKYQYVTVPVLFNHYMKRSGNFKWSYYVTMGAALNVLLKHEIKAELDQFVVDGKSTFHLDSTGYEGRRVGVNLFVGGRFDYKVDKNIMVFGQPLLTFYPVSVSKTPIQVYPIGLTFNCGITYIFDQDDK
jgi:hypothetical protein